jgi:deoxycytidylate deaminase
MNKRFEAIAIRKARSSKCTYRVSAIGLDKKGNILGVTRNGFRISRKGGGIHAEMALIARYGENIETILICRTNDRGDMLPIDPCVNCQKVAEKHGIKIVSLFNEKRHGKKYEENIKAAKRPSKRN